MATAAAATPNVGGQATAGLDASLRDADADGDYAALRRERLRFQVDSQLPLTPLAPLHTFGHRPSLEEVAHTCLEDVDTVVLTGGASIDVLPPQREVSVNSCSLGTGNREHTRQSIVHRCVSIEGADGGTPEFQQPSAAPHDAPVERGPSTALRMMPRPRPRLLPLSINISTTVDALPTPLVSPPVNHIPSPLRRQVAVFTHTSLGHSAVAQGVISSDELIGATPPTKKIHYVEPLAN